VIVFSGAKTIQLLGLISLVAMVFALFKLFVALLVIYLAVRLIVALLKLFWRSVMPKPKPFARPTVNIGASGTKRAWQERFSEEAQIGDMWAGYGTIWLVTREADHVLIGVGMNTQPYRREFTDRLMLFSEVKS
jgi:hypothetical protein